MNALQTRRLYYVIFFALSLTLAAGLILYALKQNINVFLTPTEIASKKISPTYHIRLGGLVKKGSIKRQANSMQIDFVVTDLKTEIPVHFTGIPPDLFKEGSGVIAEGVLDAKREFIAAQILAKHDENYMPKKITSNIRENS